MFVGSKTQKRNKEKKKKHFKNQETIVNMF